MLVLFASSRTLLDASHQVQLTLATVVVVLFCKLQIICYFPAPEQPLKPDDMAAPDADRSQDDFLQQEKSNGNQVRLPSCS